MNFVHLALLTLLLCFEAASANEPVKHIGVQLNWTVRSDTNDSEKPPERRAGGNTRDTYAHQWDTMENGRSHGDGGAGETEEEGRGDEEGRGGGSQDNQYSSDAATIAHSYLSGVVIPIIGLLGVLGNILNLAILSWRCLKRDDDTLEKVALVGLIALAVSDLCFCITILPYFIVPKPKVLYDNLSFALYYQLYGEYVQNVFIKTSTWLTMIVATARYIAICHPLKARFCFGIRPTRIAIICTYAFWATFSLPLLWSLDVTPHAIDANMTVYILDHGAFSNNKGLHLTFTYLWAILGYFIPVSILGFCNVCLIKALRESRRLRQTVAHTARGQCTYNSTRKSSNRITLTLIALVLMFIVLVSPSEILHFYSTVGPGTFAAYEIAMVVANVLQGFNFALHFVLYCIVNVTFRRTLVLLAFMCFRCIKRQPSQPGASVLSGMSHTQLTRRSTLTATNIKTNETPI